MEIRETVQRNVARYIKGSDYTQAEIARMLGVSKPTVTNWISSGSTGIKKSRCQNAPDNGSKGTPPERMKSPSSILT